MNQKYQNWISPLATAGYAAKGIVYGIIGVLAAMAAFGTGEGEIAGSKGALAKISSTGWGSTLLVIVGLGLLAYGVFRLLGAFADIESEGSDGSGIAKRIGYFGSGLAYTALAIFAFTGVASGSGGGGKESLTAKVLSWPFGAVLVGAVGLGIGLAGIFQGVKAARGSYATKFQLNRFAARKRHWIERSAKLGLYARCVVFLIIGFFVVKAAVQHDSSEVQGIEGALRTLAQQPYGPWLLGLTAIGLVCYGIYCEVLSVFGRWHRDRA